MAVRGHILTYIDNLHSERNLNWSELIHSMLFENIEACCKGVLLREETFEKPGTYFFGCAAVMNIFLWERTKLFCQNTP